MQNVDKVLNSDVTVVDNYSEFEADNRIEYPIDEPYQYPEDYDIIVKDTKRLKHLFKKKHAA